MIKYIVIGFIAMIVIYLLLNCLSYKETFCGPTTDSEYTEYQDVLSNSKMSQISNIIKAQLSSMFNSNTLIPGPRGNKGVEGQPGGTYVARGRLYNMTNKNKVYTNTLQPTDIDINTNQIWYMLSDGKISNEFVNASNANTKKCLGNNLEKSFPVCSDKSVGNWEMNENGQIRNKNNNMCLSIDGVSNGMILENCKNGDKKQQWFII